MLKRVVFAFVAITTLWSASPARADIVVINGVNNQGTDNILFDTVEDVLTVAATDSSGEFDVFFTSENGTELLSADASGQAVIIGGTGNTPFQNLLIEVEAGAVFTRAVFNINAASDGLIELLVSGFNIDGGTFSDTFAVDANGQNFFTVSSINGQLMTSVEILALENLALEDVRQVRMGGFAFIDEEEPPTAVPEPATMLLFGSGLAGIAAARKRRQNARG